MVALPTGGQVIPLRSPASRPKGVDCVRWRLCQVGRFLSPADGNSDLHGVTMNENCVHEITLLDQAKQALSEASSFEQIKDIRDKAEAVRKYAQSASLGLDIQNRAAEVKLRAERQAGKLLSQLMLRGGDRRSKMRDHRLKLHDLGISRNQSTRWQIQAKVPENIFVSYVHQMSAAGKEITSANLMRIAKQWGDKEVGGGSGKPRNDDSNSNPVRPHLSIRGSHIAGGERDETLTDIAGELRNHHHVLAGVLEPLIESQDSVTLKVAQRRILQYLLGEIGQLICQLHSVQHKPVDTSCHVERRAFVGSGRTQYAHA